MQSKEMDMREEILTGLALDQAVVRVRWQMLIPSLAAARTKIFRALFMFGLMALLSLLPRPKPKPGLYKQTR